MYQALKICSSASKITAAVMPLCCSHGASCLSTGCVPYFSAWWKTRVYVFLALDVVHIDEEALAVVECWVVHWRFL